MQCVECRQKHQVRNYFQRPYTTHVLVQEVKIPVGRLEGQHIIYSLLPPCGHYGLHRQTAALGYDYRQKEFCLGIWEQLSFENLR